MQMFLSSLGLLLYGAVVLYVGLQWYGRRLETKFQASDIKWSRNNWILFSYWIWYVPCMAAIIAGAVSEITNEAIFGWLILLISVLTIFWVRFWNRWLERKFGSSNQV